jgi:Acetyltransferase (GNAT) domain
MSGPPEDVTAAWMRQLYVLYVYAADHGTGAGRALLEAVIDSAEPTALWVADPNPRAQAFYRKHGFAADGTARFEDGVREIRMVRGGQHGGTGRSHRLQPAEPGRVDVSWGGNETRSVPDYGGMGLGRSGFSGPEVVR